MTISLLQYELRYYNATAPFKLDVTDVDQSFVEPMTEMVAFYPEFEAKHILPDLEYDFPFFWLDMKLYNGDDYVMDIMVPYAGLNSLQVNISSKKKFKNRPTAWVGVYIWDGPKSTKVIHNIFTKESRKELVDAINDYEKNGESGKLVKMYMEYERSVRHGFSVALPNQMNRMTIRRFIRIIKEAGGDPGSMIDVVKEEMNQDVEEYVKKLRRVWDD